MDEKKLRRKPGPPATGKGEPVMVRLLPELMTPLDAWIAQQGEPLSRPEAIRAIMAEHFRRKSLMQKRAR